MWPNIPENIADLTSVELRNLAKEIRLAAKTVLDDGPDAETLAQVQEFLDRRNTILSEAKRKEDIAALSVAVLDDEEDEAEADEEEIVEAEAEQAEVVAEVEAAPEAPAADEFTEEAVEETVEEVEVSASAKTPAKVRTGMGVTAKPEQEASQRITPAHLKARDGLKGIRAGESFASWTQLAEAVIEKASSIRSNSSEKFEVAAIPGNFGPGRILTEDPVWNLRLFEQDEIMASMCAPLQPIYDLSCANTDRRPVANSLPGFQAPRGGVTIYPSPSLSDITDQAPAGYGIWTQDDDNDPEAAKECAVIECATPEEYRIYGVWRCLTVKNLLAITYPELVEAYLNRLAAAHARVAEVQLLEAMANGAVTVTAPALGYNATTSVTSTVLNYLALYQETERWDLPGLMEAWMPRWVLHAMKMDIVRRRRTDGGMMSVPSDAQIAAMFREVGVNVHFFIDTPSWATPIPAIETAGALNPLPNQVEILVAPPGKFALMDRGELSIGVTGNNIYRDNASNRKNEFTFFFENFEGIVDTNSCPAHILEIPELCYNGVQIDDVVINCDGTPGQGS